MAAVPPRLRLKVIVLLGSYFSHRMLKEADRLICIRLAANIIRTSLNAFY